MPRAREPVPGQPSVAHEQDQPATDWFKTIPGTYDRLYAAGLRTEVSQEIWDTIPGFLAENSELLQKWMGSSTLSVFMHGSAALGVASDGGEKVPKINKEGGEYTTQPSDIDLLVVTGPQKDGTDNGWAGIDFGRESNFAERLGRRPDITIINLPDMLRIIKAFDGALDANAWPEGAYEILAEVGLILASPSMYETEEGNTANVHNELLKTILELSHGELVWNQTRELFHKLTVDYEDGAWYPQPHQAASKRNRSVRVDTAFDTVLDKRGIPAGQHEDAKEFMRAQRAAIDLPEYDQIAALREQFMRD